MTCRLLGVCWRATREPLRSAPHPCSPPPTRQVLTLLSQAQRDQQQKEHVEKLKAKQRAATHKVGPAARPQAGALRVPPSRLRRLPLVPHIHACGCCRRELTAPSPDTLLSCSPAGAAGAPLWPLRAPDAAGRDPEAAGCGRAGCAGGLQGHRRGSRRRAAAATAAGRRAAASPAAAAQQPAGRGSGAAAAGQPQRAAPAAGGGAHGAGAAAAAPWHAHCDGASRHDCAAQHAQRPLLPGEGRVPDHGGGQGGLLSCWLGCAPCGPAGAAVVSTCAPAVLRCCYHACED